MAFGKRGVFPSQREDEDEGSVRISQDAWDQMQQALGGLTETVKRLERRKPSQTVVQQVVERPAMKLHKPEIDLNGLPDPVSDKDGFLREASKRLQTQLDTVVATIKGQDDDKARQNAAAQGLQVRVNKLWSKWQKKYGKFAKADQLVELEAAKMVREGLASGQSLDDVMFADEDGFLDDLAERVGGGLEAMGVKVGDGGDDPRAAAQEVDAGLAKFEGMFKQGEMADGNDDRAGSLRAGDLGAAAPRKGKKEADKPMNMTDQLREAQEHMGIL